MKKSPLFKYQVGLAVLGGLVLGLLAFVIVQAGSARQDAKTQKTAEAIATKLNNYLVSEQAVPESLDVIKVDDVPETITYKKLSDESYKFCVTYKSAGNPASATALMSQATGGYSDLYTGGGDTAYNDTLYISTTHKKGEHCQTIKPYLYTSSYKDTSDYSSSTVQPQYKQCDIDYGYSLTYLKVKSISGSALTTNDTITPTTKLDPKVKYFDYTCKALTANDIAVDDYVSLYFTTYGGPATIVVKEY
jgi:hypothetical protein